jgi:hypothetical protein
MINKGKINSNYAERSGFMPNFKVQPKTQPRREIYWRPRWHDLSLAR